MDLSKYLRPIKTPEEAHAEAMKRGARCTECPLYGKRAGPVMGDVVPNAPLAAVGEAPGKTEVEEGRVFAGPSGVEYTSSLQNGGLRREDVTTVNVLGCRPPEELSAFLERQNREHRKACAKAEKDGVSPPPPPLSPIEACLPRLEHDLAVSNSPVLLAIGGKALQAMARKFGVPYGTGADEEGKVSFASIKQQHGSPVVMQTGEIVCSSLHPAFAMRERAYTEIVREHLARAARIVSRGNKIDWAEPEFILFPNIDTIERVCASFVANKDSALVTVDIETDSADSHTCHVRCVGLGAKLPGDDHETIIVIPFRWMDGREYWLTEFERVRAEAAVRGVLDACRLVAHNGAFDTGVCQRVGLMSRDPILKPSVMKQWFDTMIGHHDTDANDLPHDLGFVTRQYTEAPLWKKDVDHKAAEGVAKDEDLHHYNARDILTTGRLWPMIEQRIAVCGTIPQFATDSALAPVTREMSNLGIPIDETYRGLLSIEFNKLVDDFRGEFMRAVGRDINPRSPTQVAEWLFVDKGYEPPLNPQGREWEEGDKWSTSTPALLRLLDLGVDEATSHAIDRLLQFRACETIRGRYIDDIKVRYEDDPLLLTAGRTSAVVLPDGTEVMPERNALSVIHPIWKIHVVPSGRWSSEPNVQNWPSRAFMCRDVDPDHRDYVTGEMKLDKKGNPYPERCPTNLRRLVVAPPGHMFVGGDFSQIELRLYAIKAQDQLVLKAFRDGLDPHTLNAATLFADDFSKIMQTYHELEGLKKQGDAGKAKLKYLRTIAKRFVFLEAYGGEEEKLYSVMAAERDKSTGQRVFHNLTEKRVSEWHERWHKAHPETKAWHARVQRELRSRGFTQTGGVDNRKRFFPGGATKKNAPPNHEIQGNAAGIANDSVLRIAEEIPFRSWSRWTGLCLQVHDQIMLMVPTERADEACKIVEKCMYHEVEGLPIFAEVKASKDWARQD